MTQGPNRIFDEFAKLMTDSAGVAQGIRREIEEMFRSQTEKFLADMDVIKRDDFDAVQAMASKARTENELLKAKLAELETRIDQLEGRKPGSEAVSTKK